MRIHLTIIAFFGLFMSHSIRAQQLPQYSLYPLTNYTFNPAYAGTEQSLYVAVLHRSQWVGLEGAPTGQMLAAHMPLYFTNGGVGMMLEHDEIGANRFLRIRASYNQFVPLGKKSRLSVGLRASWLQRGFDGTILFTPDGEPPNTGNPPSLNDDLLSGNNVTGTGIAIGAGLLLEIPNFRFGVAAENINEPIIDFGDTEQKDFRSKRHFFVTLSYNFYTGEAVEWEAAAQIRSDMTQTQSDISLRGTYQGMFFAGGGLRGYDETSIDAVLAFAGVHLDKQFTLAYAYDIPLSDLQIVHTGSHEVMLTYALQKPVGKGRKPNIIYNPRFL